VKDVIDAWKPFSPVKILVTGSAGHLGEALVRTLRAGGHEVVGLDVLASPFTDITASITDRDAVRHALTDVSAVLHAATLHKPHVATHSAQAFIDVNISGTLASVGARMIEGTAHKMIDQTFECIKAKLEV